MKYPVFCIRDSTKNSFDPQFLIQENQQTALRSFSFMINSSNTIPNFAPNDFGLFQIGFFDTESGQFESMLPEFIVNGGSVIIEK